MMTLDEALMMCADNMRTTIDAEGFACAEDFALVCLAAEVRRLREENERLKASPPQSLLPLPADCRTCANRGHTNGLSQETYCDSCMWYGAALKKNNYRPMQEPAP